MGASLYELVTGRLPFPGGTPLEMFASVMTRPPEPLGDYMPEALPLAAEAIISRCLEKDRADRYPSMDALAAELRAVGAA